MGGLFLTESYSFFLLSALIAVKKKRAEQAFKRIKRVLERPLQHVYIA